MKPCLMFAFAAWLALAPLSAAFGQEPAETRVPTQAELDRAAVEEECERLQRVLMANPDSPEAPQTAARLRNLGCDAGDGISAAPLAADPPLAEAPKADPLDMLDPIARERLFTARAQAQAALEIAEQARLAEARAIEAANRARNRGAGARVFVPDQAYRYAGDWMDEASNGFGVAAIHSNQRYAGEFVQGDFNGLAIYEWGAGFGPFAAARYEGQFAYGRRNGLGVMRFADGVRYFGAFKNGRASGVGLVIYPDGRRYEGEVEDGLPNGYGVEFAPDGAIIRAGLGREAPPSPAWQNAEAVDPFGLAPAAATAVTE